LAPISDAHRETLRNTLAIMGGGLLPDEFWNLSSFDDFLTHLEGARLGVNVAPLVGHGTIRMAVIGFENRAPTEFELTHMKQMTAEAMQAGALGLSSGLIYLPARFIPGCTEPFPGFWAVMRGNRE